jgi:hypothetical protein
VSRCGSERVCVPRVWSVPDGGDLRRWFAGLLSRRLVVGAAGGSGLGCGLFLCVAGHGLGKRRAFGGCLGTRRR